MRESAALFRAGWLTASSYRLNLVFSLLGLGLTLVPIYFVAQALQPVAAASIQAEGGEYFGFLVVGLGVFFLVSASLLALPNAIGGGISSGTLEALLATPASLGSLLAGLMSFDLVWAGLRGLCICVAGLALGVRFSIAGVPVALVALILTLLSYAGISLILAAMILAFRTIGPLASGILAASSLLGGVYYSTTVIPSWIQNLSVLVPLTYGLRVMRQALLNRSSLALMADDLMMLSLAAAIFLGAGMIVFARALRHAREQGSLGQY